METDRPEDAMQVIFDVRRLGGKVRLVPANATAQHLCAIAGWKTMPKDRVPHILSLGCKIRYTGLDPDLAV